MTADLVRWALSSVLTITMGIIMGYRPGGGALGVLAGIALAMITGWSLAWIFMWISTIVKTAGAVQGMSMMIMFPLSFLSNASVPTGTLPRWLATIANANPVSHVVSAQRDLLNHGAITVQVGWALLGCVAIASVFGTLAVRSYARVASLCGPSVPRGISALVCMVGDGWPERGADVRRRRPSQMRTLIAMASTASTPVGPT
jgi:ABC-2 type transport system permease protein